MLRVRNEQPISDPTDGATFIAQPYVCGALGPDERGLWHSMIASAPASVKVRHESGSARFAASAALGLERVRGGWVWGRFIARRGTPKDVGEASHDFGLSGFWVDGATATLHTDGLGFQEVFVREIGETTYFSNRVSPLAMLGGERLTANWAAWRMCFALHTFTGSDTPFVEVARLEPGQRLVRQRGSTVMSTDLPRWLLDPSGTASVNDVAEALVAAMPSGAFHGIDLTLSGGLDSRLLLAASLARAKGKPVATTTPNETGWDVDVRIAELVARSAGVELREVDYGTPEWIAARRPTMRRFEHMTVLHNWLSPAAHALRGEKRRRPILDGLAGDVLLRYHDTISQRDWENHSRAMWESLGANRLKRRGVIRHSIVAKWDSGLSLAWRAQTQQWNEHPFGETVKRLLTRTNRGIAAGPFRLFGPERRVQTPFIDPLVIQTALATPPLPSNDRDLRRPLITTFNPGLASLPSTADPDAELGHFTERGRTARDAILDMVRDVKAEPSVAALYEDGLLDRAVIPARGDPDTSFALRSGAMLADWLATWRDRLQSSEFALE